MPDNVAHFYSELAQFYHLLFDNWEQSLNRQASQLTAIIKENWGDRTRTVLDVACGIGTQSIALAKSGYLVVGSDISEAEIERARTEASKRGLTISYLVADMRCAYAEHGHQQFDLVICCDNSLPHLTTDSEISAALREFYQCTRVGGGCLISVRDYENEHLTDVRIKPYGVREENGTRYIPFQVWHPKGRLYDFDLYIIEDRGNSDCRTHVFRSSYYSIGITRLLELIAQAGFRNVKRLDNRFYQPVLIGTRDV